ncbi:MAG: hypothetical protein AAFR12_09940 [Cyanobacteria bacterium J06626_6]
MESVKVKQRVGKDGILHLEIPVGLTNRDIEVMVIYQPTPADTATALSLESLYGICSDDPISIDDAGISDGLDEDLVEAFK